MATIVRRESSSGVTFLARVRIEGYKPTSKTFDTRAEAKSWAHKYEQQLKKNRERGGLVSTTTQLTVEKLCLEYLADPETVALRALRDYKRCLQWWINHYRATRVATIGAPFLREARRVLMQDDSAPGTVNRYLSIFRSAWHFGHAAGLIPEDHLWPRRKIMLKEPRGRVRYLSDPELGLLMKAAAKKGEPVVLVAIVLALATGIRRGELTRLTWDDVDFDNHTVRIIEAKNDVPRAVFLPQVACDALRTLPVGNSTRRVFLGFKNKPMTKTWFDGRWYELLEQTGIKNFRFHDMRHCAASYLAQNGASLPQIGSVLGHLDIRSTARYAHLLAGQPVPGHEALNKKLSRG